MDTTDAGVVQALDRPRPGLNELLGEARELLDALMTVLVEVVVEHNNDRRGWDLCILQERLEIQEVDERRARDRIPQRRLEECLTTIARRQVWPAGLRADRRFATTEVHQQLGLRQRQQRSHAKWGIAGQRAGNRAH